MPTPEDAAAALLADLTAVFVTEDGLGTSPGKTADLADDAWAGMRERPPTMADAESCRLAMLSCAMADHVPASRVWRARSLARAAATDWREGQAILIMSDAFSLLALANDGYPTGRTLDVLRPSPDARAVLMECLTALPDELSGSLAPGPTAPTVRSVRRMVEEKSGFLLLLEGDHAASLAAYARAAGWARGHIRGELKVRLGESLAHYLAANATGSAADSAIVGTKRLRKEVEERGIADLAAIARHNEAVMMSGGRALLPYEIL